MASRTFSTCNRRAVCCREVLLTSLMFLIVATTSQAQVVVSVGTWSEWGEWSPCTRSCGAGVTVQNRTCLTGNCNGSSVQFKSCCIQDCPPVHIDFRAEQCQRHNDENDKWIPAKQGNDACLLNCVNNPQMTGGHEIVPLQSFVANGTSCKTSDGDRGACLGMFCARVGCDGVLGSDKAEDSCLQCYSPGEDPPQHCERFSAVSTPNDVSVSGNVPAVPIPAGATMITVSHSLLPGEGTLALKSSSGNYLYTHGMNESLQDVGGVRFHLRIDYSGSHPQEILTSRGPLSERITVELINVHQSAPMVKYEYYLADQPNSNTPTHNSNHTVDIIEPPTDADSEYEWVYDHFTECSVTCGTGVQVAVAKCRDLHHPNRLLIPDNFCHSAIETPKPFPLIQKCRLQDCPPSWVAGDWSVCSVSCGNGTQMRDVRCHPFTEEGFITLPVSNNDCDSSTKPNSERPCYKESCTTHWVAGEWSQCPTQCGTWTQERSVTCQDKVTGSEVDSAHCNPATKPPVTMNCVVPCEECYWSIRLGKCDNACGYGMQNRRIHCRYLSNDRKANESCCENLPKPNRTQPCYDTRGSKCNPDWETRSFGECDCCGTMKKERTVFCGAVHPSSGELVEFPDVVCNSTTKPDTTKSCEMNECPQWQTSQWGPCSASCGDGIRNRSLSCEREDNGQRFPHEVCACRQLQPPVIEVCPGLLPCPTTAPPICENSIPDATCENAVTEASQCTGENTIQQQLCCRTCREKFGS